MAIYHLSMSVVSRGKGLSAVAKSAYNSCEKMTNEYDGVEHNYANKKGYVCGEVMLPQGAPQAWKEKTVLWNEVELSEKSKKARLARSYDIALPRELEQKEWVALLCDYCNENFVHKGLCVQWDIHDKKDGNPHAHVIVTARELDENGNWKSKSFKEYFCQNEAGEQEYYRAGEIPDGFEKVKNKNGKYKTRKVELDDLNSKETLKDQRRSWADHCNVYLREKEVKEISHLSLKDQGMDRMPQIHLGSYNMALYRRGARNERIDRFLNILEENRILKEIKHRMNEIYHEFRNTGTRESIEQEKQGIFRKLFSKKEKPEKFRMTKEQEKEMYDSLKQIHKQWQTRHGDGLDDRKWTEVRREFMDNYKKRAYEEQEAAKTPQNREETENSTFQPQNTLKNEITQSYADYEQELDQLILHSNHNSEIEKTENIQGNSLGIAAKPKENNDMLAQTDQWGAPLKKKSLANQEAIIRQQRIKAGAEPDRKGLVHSPEFETDKKKVKFNDEER